MNSLMFIAVILPILGGLISRLFVNDTKTRNIFVEVVAIVTSLLVFGLMFITPFGTFTVFSFNKVFTLAFHIDAMSKVFMGIVSFLWPFACLYAFEYMEHEHRTNQFFMFYIMTYGITLGISMSANLFTMYFFYELLTLVTIPLVVHEMTPLAIKATRTYIHYSIGGAALGFMGMIFLSKYGSSLTFTMGGVLDPLSIVGKENILRIIFIFTFIGFSIKAAMFPNSRWLPLAGVAPTPVTALLHAVAVVKAGAFACIRVTYYCFGTELLYGSFAQYTVMALAIFTIVYGCSIALKETHLKRRLAWSTVGNLSYILFGCALMTPWGLVGALCHMVMHAVMKITSFFCAGAIIHKSEKNYIFELDGMAKAMPKTFTILLISGLALMGTPLMCGFVSKYYLATAAIKEGSVLAIVGIVALMISAILTAIYMCTICARGFMNEPKEDISEVSDPTWKMLLPLTVFVVVMFVLGIKSNLIMDWLIGNIVG